VLLLIFLELIQILVALVNHFLSIRKAQGPFQTELRNPQLVAHCRSQRLSFRSFYPVVQIFVRQVAIGATASLVVMVTTLPFFTLHALYVIE
jgi:hypothetical protein